jgi:nucleotide-binding universal stress UspA family protein
MYTKLLVAYDGSEGSRKALIRAIELASCFNAELHSMSVEVDLPHYVATIGEFDEVKQQKDAYFEKLNAEAVNLAEAKGVTLIPHLAAGHAVDRIVDFVKQGEFDLLVTGFTGHGRIYETIWGGISRNLARYSPCSILIEK